MSLAELKLQAQQLGLTKEEIAKFGDLRKKSTWELAIADSASMLKSADEIIGVSEVFLHENLENSCMDAENLAIADERLVNVPISFGKTLEQLLSGQKTVTRRLWKDEYAHQFIKRFKEGRTTYPAFDKDRRYGGRQIGWITLTCCPYKQRLSDMPEADLVSEGFPELNRQEFVSRFFSGDWELKVWVVRFKFALSTEELAVEKPEEETASDNLLEPLTEPEIINITRKSYPKIWRHLEPPNESKYSDSEIIPTLFGLALKVNDEDGERCFLRNEFVELDNKLVAQVTGVFTNNLVEIQLKTREVLNVTPSRLRYL